MKSLDYGNPLHNLAVSRRSSLTHQYSLRSGRSFNFQNYNTNRMSNFVGVKYVNYLSV